MRQAVAEFAAFVDRAGGFRRDVAGNAAGEGELLEQALHPHFVAGNGRIDVAVAAFEIGVGDQGGTAMAGAGDEENAEVALFDHPVQVGVDEVQSGRRPPVPQQARFDTNPRS